MSLPLGKLMNPRAIAVVGASERPDAIGTRVIRNLRRMGFPGAIYPVNPRYERLGELPCFPSLAALPEPVDAAFLAVPATAGPALVAQAAIANIPALFINASGYADGDAAGVALQRRVEATARQHGMAVAGPNNLGLINVHDRAAIWTPRYFEGVRPGPIALISQSGSVALILAEDERKVGFAYLVTTGNEAVVTVSEYLDHFARDERVGVILLFLETVRRPDAFAAAAEEARRRGKPIIALKLGRSEGGRALVQAHTGSLAGEDELYHAFFRRLGIVRVRDFDEMLETALLFSAYPKSPTRKNFVAVTLSGGEAALIADAGHEAGVEFAPLVEETLARLRPAFPPYATIGNPIDAWGLGFSPERFSVVTNALAADPAIGTIAVAVDAPGQGGGDVPYACVMAEACAAVAAKSDKRFIFFNNVTGTGPNSEVRAILDRAGIPYLSGVRSALAAIGHFLRGRVAEAMPQPQAASEAWYRRALSLDEAERFRAVAEAGLPMAETVPVDSAAEAAAVGKRLGYPVVLKGSAPHLPHKSDLGLVRVGLEDEAALTAAFAEVAAILARHARDGAQIVLQAMAKPGIELILGIRNEPGFGSFVLVGVGGVFVGVMKEASLSAGPIDAEQARAMLRETAAGTLLAGLRGRGPYDMDAAVAAIVALSRLGAATIDRLSSIEINPLIVHEQGATGVDLLIEPAAPRNPETIP
ncbi:MAG: acetate--CoA ligase family protein [Alphaproteobacteria bacterium]|nr:acetate--CoA ligase family protein [Alphaproteobacteria bacterium]